MRIHHHLAFTQLMGQAYLLLDWTHVGYRCHAPCNWPRLHCLINEALSKIAI